MKTSVLFLTWNRIAYSKIAFDYIMRSGEEFTLIIADNGSTDGTVEWINSLQGTDKIKIERWFFKKNFGRFRVSNLFFDRMLKRGCEYFGYVFNDTAPPANWLQSFTDILNTCPEVGLVFPIAQGYENHEPTTDLHGKRIYTGNVTFMSDGFGLFRAKVFADRIAKNEFPYMRHNTYGLSEVWFLADMRNEGWLIASDPTIPQVWALSLENHNHEDAYKKHVVLVKRKIALDPLYHQMQTSGLLTWTADGVQDSWPDEPFLSRRMNTASLLPLELRAALDEGVGEGDVRLLDA